MADEDAQVCLLCGEPAGQSCGNCGRAYYCSRDHQKTHWKEHKQQCQPFKEVTSQHAGRYLVATRTISAGQLLLQESPLVVGPPATSHLVCLGCHDLLDGKWQEPPFRCVGCSWPLCSICSKGVASNLHSAVECQVLSQDTKRIGVPLRKGETPRYDTVLVLRCLLFNLSNPDAWRCILDLESHTQKRIEEQEPHQVAVVRYLTEVCKVKEGEADGQEVGVEMVHRVRGAILANAIKTRGPEGTTLRGLYPTISRLNHSCVGNVTLRSDKNGTIFVHAAVPIDKDEPLLFSYEPSMAPLWERQANLKDVYCFSCSCRRCSDVTELGTHFSSLRCPDCRQSFLEAQGPLSIEHSWICPTCNTSRSTADLKEFSEEWLAKYSSIQGSLKQISFVVEKTREVFHPESHVYLHVVQNALRSLASNRKSDALQMKKKLWTVVLDLINVLEPGCTRRRGIILYEVGSITVAAALAEKKAGGTLDHLQFRNHLLQALDLQREAVQILTLEPPESLEAHWQLRALDEVKKIDKYLEKLKD
ncbi:SET domain-containing protein SmydA-8-like [Oratosquilla oratoria]|uniref:SET domain-containing protein SmydA-8-like n=1 Tax=Oratosquilla oratoria TaxID=337810 RepID=UPI003F759979